MGGISDTIKVLRGLQSPAPLLEGLMLKLKLMRTDSLEKILMLEKIEDKRKRG